MDQWEFLDAEKKEKEQENQSQEQGGQAALTIYACRTDNSDIRETAETVFQDITMQNSTGENKAVKEAALLQIGMFNCIVGIEFTATQDANRTNAIVSCVYRLASQLTGFVLYPNMYLFQGDGRLLISIDGKTDMTEFHPMADARCVIPEKESILRRAVCVFATGICSEVFREGGSRDTEHFSQMINSLEEQYGFKSALSPKERDYLENPQSHDRDHIRYDWRYEDCAVLLWALELLEIGEPDHVCDVPGIAKLIWNHDFASLSAASTLRTKEEILDLQDLILRYDWACVDARIKGGRVEQLDPSVVHEWHYALNWLTGAGGITQWDDVRPDT